MSLVKNGRRIVVIVSIAFFFVNVIFTQPEEPHRQLSNAVATLNGKPSKALNILTLGGSVTWGAALWDRKFAYPYLLEEDGHKVLNLGIRGHGSDYPAQCIQSMIMEEESDYLQVPFDVIILEFSINGTLLYNLLVKRLQQRYPEALFMYVDLNSLNFPSKFSSSNVAKVTRGVGGDVYSFPRPKSQEPKEIRKLLHLYASDRHHLNRKGHEMVKEKIEMFISESDVASKTPRLGTWNGGDKCNTWFRTGEVPFDFTGNATLKEFDTINHKFSIEVSIGGGVIEYNHDGKHDAEITLAYMTKCLDEGGDPKSSIYPSVVIKIEQSKEKIKAASNAYKNGDFQISLSKDNVVESITSGWKFLDTVHPRIRRRRFHQENTSVVGVVKPGPNFIYVQPLENKEPFRIIATVLCEACEQH